MIRYATPRKRAAMTLSDILEQQFFPLKTGSITDKLTKAHYRRAVRWLGQMLGRDALLSDLTDDNLIGLLGWLTTTREQQPTTANGSRKCLASLWRWCRDKGLIQTGPTAEPLRTPTRTPRAWSMSDLGALCRAVATAPGTIGGYPARVWWAILFAIEMDNGIRASELLAIRWEWFDLSRGVLVVPADHRKGSREDGVYAFSSDTMAILRANARPSGLVLGSVAKDEYYDEWRNLLERAGLPNDRKTKTQKLRVSFASYLKLGGGDATAACKHSSIAVTAQHYLDPTLSVVCHGEKMPFRILQLIQQDAST